MGTRTILLAKKVLDVLKLQQAYRVRPSDYTLNASKDAESELKNACQAITDNSPSQHIRIECDIVWSSAKPDEHGVILAMCRRTDGAGAYITILNWCGEWMELIVPVRTKDIIMYARIHE